MKLLDTYWQDVALSSSVLIFPPHHIVKVKVETPKMKQIPFYQLTPTAMIVVSYEELEQLNVLLRKAKTKLLQLDLANNFPYNPS